jgi:hypothetical protein
MEEAIIFVYAKDGKIIVLPTNEAIKLKSILEKEGWEHTKTLNSCTFIEYLFKSTEKEIINTIKNLNKQ